MNLRLPRLHAFSADARPPMPDLAPAWMGHTCIYCGKVSGLDWWQIAQMPLDMARCENGRRLGLLDLLGLLFPGGSVDCRAPRRA